MEICMSEKLEYEKVPCKYVLVESNPLDAHDYGWRMEASVAHNTDWLSEMAKMIAYTEPCAKDAKTFSIVSWECARLSMMASISDTQSDIAGKILLRFHAEKDISWVYCCYGFEVNTGDVKKTLKFKRFSKTYSIVEFDEDSTFVLKPNLFSLELCSWPSSITRIF